LIDHLQRVNPHVAFRMPLRFLRAVQQGVQLGEQLLDDTEIEGDREANRRPRREQQLLELAPDALGGKVVECDAAAEVSSRLVERQFEARRELYAAQDAQAVVGKRLGIDHAQTARLQVAAAVEGVEVFAGERIPRDRVDG